MVKVATKIRIVAVQETDTYPRKFGKTIDVPLKRGFWYVQPEALLKDPATGADITGTSLDHTQTVELEEGTHTIQFSPSTGSPDLTWKAEVFVNDVSLGTQTGIYDAKPYTASFEVKKPPPTLAEIISGFTSTFMSVMMLVIMMSLLTSIMKMFKR